MRTRGARTTRRRLPPQSGGQTRVHHRRVRPSSSLCSLAPRCSLPSTDSGPPARLSSSPRRNSSGVVSRLVVPCLLSAALSPGGPAVRTEVGTDSPGGDRFLFRFSFCSKALRPLCQRASRLEPHPGGRSDLSDLFLGLAADSESKGEELCEKHTFLYLTSDLQRNKTVQTHPCEKFLRHQV